MPNPNTNGSGEAYQSWNSDQQMATTMIARAAIPDGLRPPVSDSATSSSSSALVGPLAALFAMSLVTRREPFATRKRGADHAAPRGFRCRCRVAYFTQPFSL